MIFKSESDVRSLIRANVPGIKFIEYGMGGTDGLPDCFLPGEGRLAQWWMELKLGKLVKGELRYDVRAAQVREIKGLIGLGHKVYVGVGLVGTEVFLALDAAVKGAVEGRIGCEWGVDGGEWGVLEKNVVRNFGAFLRAAAS